MTTDRPNYEPLRVTAELMSQVMLDRPAPLDGLLGAAVIEDPEAREMARRARAYHFYQVNCRKYGREATDKWYIESPKYGAVPPPVWGGHSLPLAVWGHGEAHGLWVYAASRGLFGDTYERDVVHFTKRLDLLAAADYVRAVDKKINVGKGEFTAKYLPFQTVETDSLTWYVLGLRKDVEFVLQSVLSIAKKRARGYGRVRRWVVEPVDEDCSVFTPEGHLLRPVPAELLERLNIAGEFAYEFTTYRPPYWQTKYAARCAVAGRREPVVEEV